jgi:hypothetical protein
VKLWEAQQMLCRYEPEAVLFIKTPDGYFAVDHLEDHYEKKEGGPTPKVTDRCPTFVSTDLQRVIEQAGEAEAAHQLLDGLGIPREEQNPRAEDEQATLQSRIDAALEMAHSEPPEYEYEATSQSCELVGVDKARVPNPPPTPGWELVSAACSDNSFWYWWRRPKRTR